MAPRGTEDTRGTRPGRKGLMNRRYLFCGFCAFCGWSRGGEGGAPAGHELMPKPQEPPQWDPVKGTVTVNASTGSGDHPEW